MDVVMIPVMAVFAVPRRIKSDPANQHIPVVTSLSEVEDRVRAMEAGVEDFFQARGQD
jgi:two-component system cell cycle response regulator